MQLRFLFLLSLLVGLNNLKSFFRTKMWLVVPFIFNSLLYFFVELRLDLDIQKLLVYFELVLNLANWLISVHNFVFNLVVELRFLIGSKLFNSQQLIFVSFQSAIGHYICRCLKNSTVFLKIFIIGIIHCERTIRL